MDIEIRNYQPADLEMIAQLFYDTVHAVNSKDYSQEQVDMWAPKGVISTNLKQALQNDLAYVALNKDTLVGFGTISSLGFLGHLYVHKDFQGMGIGAKLLKALEAQMQALGIREIQTYASITARPFFERQGFVVIKENHVVRETVTFLNYFMVKE